MAAGPVFHGWLTLTQIGEANGRPLWRVESKLMFWSPILAELPWEFLDLITIPVGFITDLASAPRVPFAWLIAGGVANGPAVLHDYLYALKWPAKIPADRVFNEAMGVHLPDQGFHAVPRWKRWPMYRMVHHFGHSAWADYTSISRQSLGLPPYPPSGPIKES